jgi:uncharacterized protein (DUF736 family)
MTTIGTFTKSENGYAGTVRTLNVNVKVKIVPNDKSSDNSPDYRVLAGNYEIGAAWQKTSQANRPYLSVSLDDPSFPSAIYARLVESDDGSYSLIWSRPNND